MGLCWNEMHTLVHTKAIATVETLPYENMINLYSTTMLSCALCDFGKNTLVLDGVAHRDSSTRYKRTSWVKGDPNSFVIGDPVKFSGILIFGDSQDQCPHMRKFPWIQIGGSKWVVIIIIIKSLFQPC